MKYVDEFRDGERAKLLAQRIEKATQPDRSYRFMEFCGGHTHALSRYGLVDLLPPNIRMIHGPGCPVCVLPIGRIDMAIDLVLQNGVILCAYGDSLRVPASHGLTLLKARARARAEGGAGKSVGEVRMVYATTDALQIARDNPERQVVFFAIGFETTTPPTAFAVLQAQAEGLRNFSVLCTHVLTPPAMTALLGSGTELDGIVGPAHVSIVIGAGAYRPLAERYRMPIVISGFEPLDLMQSILMLLRQVNEGRAEIENEFTRTVSREGNLKAQTAIAKVFELRESFEWRGLGSIAHSALRLRPEFSAFDAEQRFAVPYHLVADNKACECPAILRGQKSPEQCKIFGTVCTPDNPIGSCMVSSEGACAAHYQYGRHRQKVD